jgi:glutaminase
MSKKKNNPMNEKNSVVENVEKNKILEKEFYPLFKILDKDNTGIITLKSFKSILKKQGISDKDTRISFNTIENYNKLEEDNDVTLTFDDFMVIVNQSNANLIKSAIQGNLIIPDFQNFVDEIREFFEEVKTVDGGKVATYIPQLGRVDPDKYAVSICTIDGQMASFGDFDEYFCVQSISKPINYCIALEDLGEEVVHNHVGREPSGISFNGLVLNSNNLPHNPMINSGAIMTCSLVKQDLVMSDRFENVLDIWTKLSGNNQAKFNNSVYLSERSTADRNFALGYFMKENKAFPQNTNLIDTLEFYFQCCSIEVTNEMLAICAATFANAGICPTTGNKIFNPDTIKNCLSLLYSCGMYDFSGEFAFSIGLPAKSGVAGGLLIVIPNLMGIAVWSPKLDKNGNTVKGIEFCKKLVEKYNFHNYDSLISGVSPKKDPRLRKNEAKKTGVIDLCWAASTGDLFEVQQLVSRGLNINDADYDGRTPLHIAASEGHAEVVEYLLKNSANASAKDRWGNTPLDDAKRSENKTIIEILSI